MINVNLNDKVDQLELKSVDGFVVKIPHDSYFTHLQFRRFAGCPMCNLHIQSFIKGHEKLLACGVQEVVIFHSTKTALLSHQVSAPFPLIADPDKALYRKFNVDSSLMSVMHPSVWLAAVKGLLRHGIGLPDSGESIIGLPADFFIDSLGKIVAMKYGAHAYDHWELEEVVGLASDGRAAMSMG